MTIHDHTSYRSTGALFAILRAGAVCALSVTTSCLGAQASVPETDFNVLEFGVRGTRLGDIESSHVVHTDVVPLVRGAHYFGKVMDDRVQSFVSMGLLATDPAVFAWALGTQLYLGWWGAYLIDSRPCREGGIKFPPKITNGLSILEPAVTWRYDSVRSLCGDLFPGLGTVSPARWTLPERTTISASVRRRALDGGEYDARRMAIERNDNPWISYYWGYMLGLVESQTDWDDRNRSNMPADWPIFPSAAQDFKLTTLPPPWVEGEVTEYVNTADFPKQPDGQYFYAATDEDRAALDAVAAWQRTGNRFKHGGYVSVCRFYGGKNGGPNTHFYSASDTECNWLKGFSFLSYEGQTFRVNLPLPLAANAPPGTQPSCPAGSIPLYRLYNNAGAPGKTYVSNHRYVTTRSAVDAAVTKGWLDEGTVMCVPQ